MPSIDLFFWKSDSKSKLSQIKMASSRVVGKSVPYIRLSPNVCYVIEYNCFKENSIFFQLVIFFSIISVNFSLTLNKYKLNFPANIIKKNFAADCFT